ncbi:MAG: tetratricopeptide repeat protein, partial [Parachlamydiaceae bacterium]
AYVLGENKEKYKLEKLGKYANEALKIKNTIFPSKHPSRASSLAFIGDYHFEVEKFDQAEKCFEECYSIYRSHGDRRHDDVYKQIVNNYYHILIKLCKYEKAEIVLFDFLKDLGSRDKTTNFPDILKFRELHIKICFSLKINKDDIPSSHFALIKKRIDDHNTCLDNLLGSYRSGYDENIDVETV